MTTTPETEQPQTDPAHIIATDFEALAEDLSTYQRRAETNLNAALKKFAERAGTESASSFAEAVEWNASNVITAEVTLAVVNRFLSLLAQKPTITAKLAEADRFIASCRARLIVKLTSLASSSSRFANVVELARLEAEGEMFRDGGTIIEAREEVAEYLKPREVEENV